LYERAGFTVKNASFKMKPMFKETQIISFGSLQI
jgi:hypothetical protein